MRRPVLAIHAIDDDVRGDAFAARFAVMQDAYRAWFGQAGDAARPSYVEARAALRRHMPELVPVWEQLTEAAGGSDFAARLLAHWCPPVHIAACTQAVVRRAEPVLVRNYDYDLKRLDATILRSSWLVPTIGTGDCVWGLLDGLNDQGLAVSITFGGAARTGRGFGISIVVRYLLETCATVAEALAALERVPVHLAYNVTVLDVAGAAATAYVRPGRPPEAATPRVVTNHQGDPDTERYRSASRSRDREAGILAALDDPAVDEEAVIRAFLAPPAHVPLRAAAVGTLYTAVLRPSLRCVDYRWPAARLWRQRLDGFTPGVLTIALAG